MTSRLPTGFRPPPQGEPVEAFIRRLAQAIHDCRVADVGGVRGGTVMDGEQWSGVADLVRAPSLTGTPNRNGIPAQVLSCRRMGTSPLGGMATVHVQVSDVVNAHEVAPNQKLVLDLKWQSGRAGGEATVDIGRGGVFTIGAADIVEAQARIIPATDAAFQPGSHKRVEATVSWGTSINPKPAMMVSEGQVQAVLGATTRVAVPAQAASMIVVTNDPANYGTLRADFFRETAFGGPPAYSTLNPNANGTPLVAGTEFVGATTTVAATVFFVFELWL